MAAKIGNLFKNKPRQKNSPGLFFHREDKKIWVIYKDDVKLVKLVSISK